MKLLSNLKRLKNLFVFRRRAAQIGISYSRGRNWQLPKRMRFQGAWFSLSAPDDGGSSNAFLDVFLADVYGLLKGRKPIQTVVDVGAHVGFFSLRVRMLHPEAIIHAYEPNPSLWQHLDSHAERAQFHAIASAVGLVGGQASLDFPGDSVFTKTRQDAMGKIKQTAIADAVERIGGQVDLLKLDCEGAEWEILQDRQTLKRVRMIVMEYHLMGEHTVAELISILEGNGFSIRLVAEDHPTCGRVWADRKADA